MAAELSRGSRGHKSVASGLRGPAHHHWTAKNLNFLNYFLTFKNKEILYKTLDF